MLNELMEEYQVEMEKFPNLKQYENRKRAWIKNNPDKRPWEYPERRPNPNKAKVKRLGIMIRQKMIEAEKGLDGYE